MMDWNLRLKEERTTQDVSLGCKTQEKCRVNGMRGYVDETAAPGRGQRRGHRITTVGVYCTIATSGAK